MSDNMQRENGAQAPNGGALPGNRAGDFHETARVADPGAYRELPRNLAVDVLADVLEQRVARHVTWGVDGAGRYVDLEPSDARELARELLDAWGARSLELVRRVGA